MAQFTNAQTSASTIKQMKKEYIDGTFHHWVFRISDSSGLIYRWSNYILSENANKAAIVGSIKAHMTGSLTYRGTETLPITSCSYATDGVDELIS